MTHPFAATPGQTAFYSAGGELAPSSAASLSFRADFWKRRASLTDYPFFLLTFSCLTAAWYLRRMAARSTDGGG